MSNATATIAATASIVTPNSLRIAGLGWALCLCLVVAGILFCVCFAFSHSEYSSAIQFGCVLFLLFLILILNSIPKVQPGSIPPTQSITDGTFYPRIVFATIIGLASMGSVSLALAWHLITPVRANFEMEIK